MASRAKDWLRQAKRDLSHAEEDAKIGFYEWACFSAQQAAEKAVKALFQHLHAQAWGHSITTLIRGMIDSYPEAKELLSVGKKLDKYYIQPRYPNGFDEGTPEDYFTEEDALEAITNARRIIDFCGNRIPE